MAVLRAFTFRRVCFRGVEGSNPFLGSMIPDPKKLRVPYALPSEWSSGLDSGGLRSRKESPPRPSQDPSGSAASSIQKQDPLPISDSMPQRPPILSMARRTMARPIPVPG